MGDTLVINGTPTEVRVALLENGAPTEVTIERHAERGVVGNVYRGRVVRVLPGMQAAFVDIGLERTAFLYVDDALPRAAGDGEGDEAPGEAAAGRRGFRAPASASIADVVRYGQEIVVQVLKEPLGSKGARITKHVTLPGRSLVLAPFVDHVGVSHRIEAGAERQRLRQALEAVRPPGVGFIVRTAAAGQEAETLRHEALGLLHTWRDIVGRAARPGGARLLYADLDLVLRATRELFSPRIDRVVVDNEDDFTRLRAFVAAISPGAEAKVVWHSHDQPIFDHFGIEVEIERALDRRVWLKSGGTIVIDQAEALCAIDVNSGRFVGKTSLEETITQINLEAVKEVAYQLRLRNIGGIIIIDFIDMAEARNRDKVLAALTQALSYDRARTTVVRMSEIGLVEMTRKRIRVSLGQLLTQPCPTCGGRSVIKSEQTVANEVLRAIVRAARGPGIGTMLVNVQPAVADYLYDHEAAEVARIEARHGLRIVPVARDGYHREHFQLVNAARR